MLPDLKTLRDAIEYFSDDMHCIDAVASMRWLDGKAVCPQCAHKEHYWLGSQKRWKCKECKKQFSVKVGTIFEDSPIRLGMWLTAIWLLANCKNGISSYELHRDLGVTQKTAWFMLHRIRLALQNGFWAKMGGSDGGVVEVDETFVGGKPKNMHLARRMKMQRAVNGRTGKAIVMGMLDRDSRQVRAKVVRDVKRETLQTEILDHIKSGSRVYTDGHWGYDKLAEQQYTHETVNHLQEYVRGQVHTQGIENFWSLLKRGLNGTYVAVEPFHLSRYVDEQVFRYNNRASKDNPLHDGDRFMLAISQVLGKRLTYKELTGKVGETAGRESEAF
jgi:transposase-like protein